MAECKFYDSIHVAINKHASFVFDNATRHTKNIERMANTWLSEMRTICVL